MKLLVAAVVLLGAAASAAAVLDAGATGDPTSQSLIAVARTDGGLALIDARGRRIRTLTSRRGWRDWAPAWSPDGTRIAFTRTTDGDRSFHVYVMRANGGGVRRITSGRFDEEPAWSPDGRWIAYVASDGVRVVRPNGTGRRLVARTWPATAPSWTPEGRLAYSFHPEAAVEWPPSCRAASARCGWVWTSRLDGRDRRPVVRGRDAHWSPDGRTIVYTPPDGGVAIRRAAGGTSRMLGRGYLADWSADGTKIVFARLGEPPAGDAVWVMNRDGTARTRLMRGATMPAWRPAAP